MYVMNDFQKYLDESLPKIKFSELTDSEYRMPTQDIYIEIQQMILGERKKQKMTQKELAKEPAYHKPISARLKMEKPIQLLIP